MRRMWILSVLAGLLAPFAMAGTVLIEQNDLVPSGIRGVLIARYLEPGKPDLSQPLFGPRFRAPEAELLKSQIARGISGGFGGIMFENRDRGHSTLPKMLFPQMTYLEYDPILQKVGWDYGLANKIVIPGPLIGNSSTALTAGPNARSQMRAAMTVPLGPETAFLHYTSNSLYVYPEHRDHDARDLYPAIWPYTVNSQGSSGSDRLFMRALLMTLAGFSEKTRAALEERKLVAPTLQMIMRRNLAGVNSNVDYMSGVAQRSAYDGADLRPERMVAQAGARQPEQIPPMVRLDVEEEDFGPKGGLMQMEERLFTTPASIARIWRSYDWEREITLSAAGTEVPEGQDVQFFWRILRGNPQKISIEPLDERGTRARIRIQWHDDYPAPPLQAGKNGPRKTSRVDIGVFASNGSQIGAPSFLSVSFPTHQERQYGRGDDGEVRLQEVNYDSEEMERRYDPLLFWSAPWRDTFLYGDDGTFEGWLRRTAGGEEKIAPDGFNEQGVLVLYNMQRNQDGTVNLVRRGSSGAAP